MPATSHLTRLAHVWTKRPVYFITCCVAGRRPLLTNDTAYLILRVEWLGLRARHGWTVGRYVVMPDHVHFFVSPLPGNVRSLSIGIGKWKEWTSRRMGRALGLMGPVWQPEFFDYVLRSNESRSEKWDYVKQNPVRAGLTERADDWPYAGAIDFE